jgi:hypothetical protein
MATADLIDTYADDFSDILNPEEEKGKETKVAKTNPFVEKALKAKKDKNIFG